ncbi:MAG: hypothetical protein JWQ81_6152 [Amycolatopsis sp.]|uniref:hypothetical protein n=1 Tax=Amycolatopsis sp. TaxID=37632 RepID=UPI0026047489|nr:hypothetical protein [Amycolatopsis sp.]MCU1685413.1 hypothetical protein [Amycolatopsis sp.]
MTGPYGEGGGYSYTAGALNSLAGQLNDGAQALDNVASRAVNAVDAGASSAAVGTVLSDIIQMATAAAGAMGGTASRVHSANGSYDDIENSNAGQMKLNADNDTPDSRLQDGVHG